MNHWTFEICEDWGKIWDISYQQKWDLLMKNAFNAHVFFTPTLSKAWVKTYLPIRNLTPIFIWGKSEKNEVFFPLVLWKKNWKSAFLKKIIPIGYSDFDYHNPIFLSEPNREEVISFWKELTIQLDRYSYDEIMIDGLDEKYLPPNYIKIHEEPCPFISINDFSNITEFKDSLNRKLRMDINRRIKKASEEGEVEYITYNSTNLVEALHTLDNMLKLHSQRWPKAYKAPNFHKNLLEEGIKDKIIHFSQININKVPISWRIGFIFNYRFYSYMPTINPEYQKLSPGKIHLIHCIEIAIDKQLEVYDQLRGAELYKSEWTNQHKTIYNVRKESNSPLSYLKQYMCKIKACIQQ